LGEAEIESVKATFGFDPKVKFFTAPEVKEYYSKVVIPRGAKKKKEWEELLKKYSGSFPEDFAAYENFICPFCDGKEPDLKGIVEKMPKYAGGKAEATRRISETELNSFAAFVPQLFGGSADLACCTFARINNSVYIKKGDFKGRNIPYGIREHGMCAIGNGIASFLPSFIPIVSTFAVFAGYGFGALRVAALSELHVMYILTHDSVCVGEDGPTHQVRERSDCIICECKCVHMSSSFLFI
jgi:transketolase